MGRVDSPESHRCSALFLSRATISATDTTASAGRPSRC